MFNSLLIFLASSKLISSASSFALSITSFIANTCVAPVCSSIFTSTFSNASKFLLYAVINAVLIDSNNSSFFIPFSFSNSSKAIINSLLSIAFIFYSPYHSYTVFNCAIFFLSIFVSSIVTVSESNSFSSPM